MERAVRSERRELRLDDDVESVARLVRILGASANVKILRALVDARRATPTGGWMFLSEIAEGIGERPGTAMVALEKLMPLLEERREKGRRYFRSRVRDLRIVLDRYPAVEPF